MIVGHEFLHSPGPTHIPQRVLNAMSRQPLDLVDKRLVELSKSCFDDMKRVFRTAGRVFIYAGNGHGGWEAALANLCVPGDSVLVPVCGHFSHEWAKHAEAMGIQAITLEGEWRRAIDPNQVESRLRQDTEGRIKAVLAVQVDTGTGVINDIPAIRRAIDAAGHPALLVADTVASLAAIPFDMDAWGVDVAITASQKALMCPPGLAIVAANEQTVAASLAAPRHQRYWNWDMRVGSENYTRFCGTIPEQLMFGLREALNIIEERGLENSYREPRRLMGAVHRAVEAWSQAGAMEFNATVPAERAATVTAIRTAPGIDPEQLRTYAREELGLSLAGGLGQLAGSAFRIGHMGSINIPMVLGCLATVDLALKKMGLPHGEGAVEAAIRDLAQEAA
jgi:alanine-glyoxylate transaminase/serine-glyoxylate transaminase/serine-pyruvate transaminase